MPSVSAVATDNDKLHATHDGWTNFREFNCGCIKNEAGWAIRYCITDNPKRGTHNRRENKL